MNRFFLIPAMLGLFALPAYAEIQVKLKEFAEVQSRQVRLADVAVLQSDTQPTVLETIGRTLVTTIAHLNQPVRLDADQVARLIARQQPALHAQVRLAGAPAVTVIAPGTTLQPETLAEAARSFLEQELAQRQYRFDIRTAQPGTNAIVVPIGELQLKPHLAGQFKPAQRIHVAVDVLVNGQRVNSARVGIDVDMLVPVYRLLRPMAAGETLHPEDYALTEQPVDQLTRGATLLDTKADFPMLRLRRNVAANALLYRDDVEPVPHVARNQKILAEVNSRGILIEKSVTAKSDGQLGQVIKVADSQSATTYSAKVIAYGRVEVK